MSRLTFEVFNSENWYLYEKWHAENDADLDIYYHPGFLKCEERLLNGNAEVYLISDNEHQYFLYPVIKRRIPVFGFEKYFDLTSPYGYCGPFTNTDCLSFFQKSEQLLCQFLKKQNVVNEFIRYHYLYNKVLQFSKDVSNLRNRRVVIIDGTKTWEDIWMNEYSATNRNVIRKMEKDRYHFYFTNKDDLYDVFIEMYYKTMDNVAADSNYYFPHWYFMDLKNKLKGNLRLAIVERDGIIYSASLFFLTPKFATYYLSARNLQYSKIPAVNFLLHKSIQHFQGAGISVINLGGGTNDESENSLFRFKQHFSKNVLEFCIGKRIFLPEIQERLKEVFKAGSSEENFRDRQFLLQFYR